MKEYKSIEDMTLEECKEAEREFRESLIYVDESEFEDEEDVPSFTLALDFLSNDDEELDWGN